jgi:hypothetical protein
MLYLFTSRRVVLLAALGLACGAHAQTRARDVPTSTWQALNATVKGRLHVGIPYARPCFSLAGNNTGGTANAAECAAVQKNYLNPGTPPLWHYPEDELTSNVTDSRLPEFGAYMAVSILALLFVRVLSALL